MLNILSKNCGHTGFEPVTSSVSGLLGDVAYVRQARSRCLRCCPGVAVVAIGRPSHRARGGHDFLIRRSRHIGQDRPSLAIRWANIPELSTRVGRCPAAWQQYWQQPHGRRRARRLAPRHPQGPSVPLSRPDAPEDPVPELPGPQQRQPLADCPLRNRLVNALAPAARYQAAPATVAVAVTAVSHDGHISFLLTAIVSALRRHSRRH